MLIVPFIHKITVEKDMNIHNIRILTIGGKYLWNETGSKKNIESKYLNHNDIYCNNIGKIDNMYLCKVDTEKTNITDLYKWNEIDINDNDKFCWRDYIYIIGKNKECWLNLPKNEKIDTININKIIAYVTQIK